MKKTFIVMMALVLGLGLAIVSCSSQKIGIMKGQSYKTGQWIDDETYALSARGAYPKEDEDNPIVREESALKAAQLKAMYEILGKFTGAKIQGAAGMKDFRLAGIAVSEEIEGTIKGGSVEESKCDDNGCEVIYVVHAKGLKKMVESTKMKGGAK